MGARKNARVSHAPLYFLAPATQATMYYRNHHLLININFDHHHVLNFNPLTAVCLI